MLEFQKTQKEQCDIFAPWFAVQKTRMGDFSLGFQFMWHRALAPEYAVSGDCLLLRELLAGKHYFHYPLSQSGDPEAELAAVREIEEYCRDRNLRLQFTNVPKERLGALLSRYAEARITNVRRWRDYLYRAEDFKTYAGSGYAGQRNHVRKFLKTYPDWAFRPAREEEMEDVFAFLHEYEGVQKNKKEALAEAELEETYALLPHAKRLGLFCGVLTVGGKIVALSVGERCGDTMIVHVEKALREYEGIYPFTAQQFARTFCGEGIVYINRMDDAGDKGLRKSKLQYLPCALIDKFTVIPARAIDGVTRLPVLRSERLTLAPLSEKDLPAYFRLASDRERNAMWGYDWSADRSMTEGVPVGATPPPERFLKSAQNDFKEKREMPLGIYEGGALVGEVTLHRFGYTANVEIGVRLLPEAEGKGYASEAVRRYAEYAFISLGAERVEAKCVHANVRSANMLRRAGMKKTGADETYFYFVKTAAM